jgi:SnoaL-like domain
MEKKKLRPAEMLAVFRKHAGAEFAQDLDKTMEFVAENPAFEWPALNLRIEGRKAVREMYSRLLSRAVDRHVLYQRAFAAGEDVLMTEYVLSVSNPDGTATRIGLMALIEFDGDKIKSERTYTHPAYTPLLREALGTGFDTYPGVSPITQDNYDSVMGKCVRATFG